MSDQNEDQFITLDDVAEQLKVTKGTLYYYIKTLKIETKKFPLDRRAYMPIVDFEKIKSLKERANRGSKAEKAEKQPDAA